LSPSGYLERHFNLTTEIIEKSGLVTLGPLTSASFLQDPRSLLFRASRYKFVASTLGKDEAVLEIGCGDASMSPLVYQSSKSLTCVDLDPLMITYAVANVGKHFPIAFETLDISSDKLGTRFDTIFCLDVLEHIPLDYENEFIRGVCRHLKPSGKFIVGTPSLASQMFTSESNKLGHVNCKSPETLINSLDEHFETILTFGMNDEVLHTGFGPFRNYLFAVCSNPRSVS